MKYQNICLNNVLCSSPPSRGAWIEIQSMLTNYENGKSPPSRGAWIEMIEGVSADAYKGVAPLAGGVD